MNSAAPALRRKKRKGSPRPVWDGGNPWYHPNCAEAPLCFLNAENTLCSSHRARGRLPAGQNARNPLSAPAEPLSESGDLSFAAVPEALPFFAFGYSQDTIIISVFFFLVNCHFPQNGGPAARLFSAQRPARAQDTPSCRQISSAISWNTGPQVGPPPVPSSEKTVITYWGSS